MPERILIMGLPGAGKTFLAKELEKNLQAADKTVAWFNADLVREKFNDWDFSPEGRIRQSLRMRELANQSETNYVICDFVAPLPVMRLNFEANWTIWVDTITQGRFEDTNKMFTLPRQHEFEFRVTEQNAEKWGKVIAEKILLKKYPPLFDWRKETVQMLGRWQPWHAGHRALFERLLNRTGQVCIMIRDCKNWQDSNPFDIEEVECNIRRDLDPMYKGQYEVIRVPNIVHIGYGRGVGYTIEEEKFGEEIASISATQIRKEMGLK